MLILHDELGGAYSINFCVLYFLNKNKSWKNAVLDLNAKRVNVEYAVVFNYQDRGPRKEFLCVISE